MEQPILVYLQEVNYECPGRVDKEKNYANRVWYTLCFCEGISEPTRCPDVFLQQITRNGKTYRHTNQVAPKVAREYTGSHNYQKNQSCGQLQPIGEMSREKETQDYCNESNPLPNISPEEAEENWRKTKENVGDE